MKNKKLLAATIIVIICLLLIIVGLFLFNKREQKARQEQTSSTQTPQQTKQDTSTPVQEQPATNTNQTTPTQPVTPQWPVQISMADASSLTVVVNKKHQLPSTYVPSPIVTFGGRELRSEAATAMNNLFNAAQSAGYGLKMISGYRSYSYQQNLYNGYVAQDGQAQADTYSARPGFSEHQLGLAADVGNASGSCDLDTCFGDSAAGKWIAANAQNYGFIVRYPQGKDAETGYQYEPWHLRYLGVDVAKSVYASGKTLDQYYNVPAGGYQ